jgi:acyl carrier protein
MSYISVGEIRSFVLSRLAVPLAAVRLAPQDVPDDFDLLVEGVIDSLGIVELISAIEEQFNLKIDFENLDADDLTIVGPLCRYIQESSSDPEKLRA